MPACRVAWRVTIPANLEVVIAAERRKDHAFRRVRGKKPGWVVGITAPTLAVRPVRGLCEPRNRVRRCAGPVLECEALVKIAYADQGTRDGLLANLTTLIDDTTAKFDRIVSTAGSPPDGPDDAA
jgi:hypothetical protein